MDGCPTGNANRHKGTPMRNEQQARGWQGLTSGQYGQLVKDLTAAQRAFRILEDVHPSLLEQLARPMRRRARAGAFGAAHAAVEDLITELQEHRREIVTPRRKTFPLLRGGQGNGQIENEQGVD
jgi:hypothetical protein